MTGDELNKVAEKIAREAVRRNLVTAGELRDKGIEIPASIPDCATAPRDSMKIDFDLDAPGGGVIEGEMMISFTEPFTWWVFSLRNVDPTKHSDLVQQDSQGHLSVVPEKP